MSKANPYNIVQQGKVKSLIKMKNSERLELLKKIAGTRTYDDRRKESMKIMDDTDKSRNQIEEVCMIMSHAVFLWSFRMIRCDGC